MDVESSISLKYKAFISYSHAADGDLAPQLQRGLSGFARPWYRLRSMRLFRDATNLSISPKLWPSIENALLSSEYFLLLASPQSADSKWVRREIEFWLTHKPHEKLLILLTDGELVWDAAARDFDWKRTTALPRFDYQISHEPRHTDLRTFGNAEGLSQRDPEFRSVVADIASTLLGEDKDNLIGEDIRRYRQARRIAGIGVFFLALLTVASLAAAYIAYRNQLEAEQQTLLAEDRFRLAQTRQLNAQSLQELSEGNLDRALLLAMEAYDPPHTFEGRRALLSALQTNPQLVTYLRPNSSTVNAVAYSPDGSIVALAAGSEITLWETVNWSQVGPALSDHRDTVLSLAISPDGQYLASGSRTRNNLLLWNLHDRRAAPRVLIPDGIAAVQALAFSPDGKVLVSGGGDQLVRTWNVDTANEVGEPLAGHTSNVAALDFSADGAQIVSGGWDNATIVWDLSRRASISKRSGRRLAGAVSFAPDSKLVAAADAGSIQFWDPRTEAQTTRHPLPISIAVDKMIFLSPSELIFAGDRSPDVVVWNLDADQKLFELRGHRSWITDLAVSPKGDYLVSGSADGTAIVWKLQGDSRISRKIHGEERITTVLVNDRQWFVGRCSSSNEGPCRNGRIEISDGENSARVLAGKSGPLARVESMALDKTRSVLRSVHCLERSSGRCSALRIRSWDLGSGEELPNAIEIQTDSIRVLALDSFGDLLATAHSITAPNAQVQQSEVRFWDTRTGKPVLLPLIEPNAVVRRLLFSPETGVIAVGTNDNVTLWNIENQTALHPSFPGAGFDFDSDGSRLVTLFRTQDEAMRIVVWDTSTGNLLNRADLYRDQGVLGIAFSSDGTTLALAGSPIVLWDIEQGRELGRSLNFGGDRIRFDGRDSIVAIGGSSNSDLFHWDLDIRNWPAKACWVTRRNLTSGEWDQHMTGQAYTATCPQYARSLEERLSLQALESQPVFGQRSEIGTDIAEAATEALLKKGKEVALRGNLESALNHFQDAVLINPELEIDPDREARLWVATGLLGTADRYLEVDLLQEAVERYQEAISLVASLPAKPVRWNKLCWSGALAGRATDLAWACERAVAEGSDLHQDALGISFALRQNTAGSIKAFRKYMSAERKYLDTHRMGLTQREGREAFLQTVSAWVAEMENGTNPFEDSGLRAEQKPPDRWQ